MTGGAPLLEVAGLARRFGGVRALDGVDLTVRAGEIVGIIGPNGSGKTTLVNCITGFVRPTGGTVRFDGRDITGLKPHRVADLGVARTFQVMRPWSGLPAWRNLVVPLCSPRARRLGGRGDRDTRALDLLEELGFERGSRVPRQRAGTLPTGYLKRLELGRGLALQPRLMICDEAFSGLSPGEIATLVPLIERLRDGGMTLVMVEHRLRELFAVADRVVALSFGRVIADGPPEGVLDHPEVRSAYLGPEEAAP